MHGARLPKLHAIPRSHTFFGKIFLIWGGGGWGGTSVPAPPGASLNLPTCVPAPHRLRDSIRLRRSRSNIEVPFLPSTRPLLLADAAALRPSGSATASPGSHHEVPTVPRGSYCLLAPGDSLNYRK